MVRTRAVLASAVAVSALLLTAAPGSADSAIAPSNRPTPLAGVENGRVPNDRLITVIPGCRAAREAGPSLALLYKHAAASGVALGAADCYRLVDDQVAISANQKANGGPCTATPSRYPDGRVRGTSNHGWGKATDISDGGLTMTFTSPGYRFLKGFAGQVGWNHPGWAEPGTNCPEPWHWEWVGDGGQNGAPPIRADVVSLLRAPDDRGYATVTGLGKVTARGSAVSYGDASGLALNWVVVGAAPTAAGLGYWLLGADGGIFTYGDAGFFGSTGSLRLNQPVVAMAAAPTGRGYWLVAGDGGIFAFGDAGFFGSTGSMRLNKPIVGMASTPSGRGYWLVASDGGIFAFGDAAFLGSTGSIRLNKPIVGMASTPSGRGYWLVASDGGIFAFGDAAFLGSASETPLVEPVVGLTRTARGDGYWLVTAGGGVVSRGAAGAFGSG